MTMNVLPTELGVCNSQTISAEVSSASLSTKKAVSLSFDYARSIPPNFPDPNPGVAVGTSVTIASGIIPSGTTFETFSAEADALVSAGVASYA